MMRKFYGLLFIMAMIFSDACSQKTPTVTTFILYRHAEKGNDGTEDPDLKPEGVARSKRIVEMLKNTSIDAIYATRYKRAKNTVVPLAEAKGLEVQTYESFKPEVIEAMVKKHSGGTVVISGHSNDIPWIANLLIGKDEYKAYADADYGNVLIVSVVEKGKVAKVTWLSY
jgi:2,3-bisphosphoglycerate-dependent phosphoglycerate mutase